MKKSITLFVLTLILSACSGVPESKEIETMVRASVLSEGLEGLFALEKFAKTNGFRESDNVYVVDVEYDLVFQKSFVDVVREIRDDPTGPQYGMFGSKFVLAAIQSNFGQFDAGDRIRKKDKIRLHKTEQGWQLAK
ncbi:MAG: lipoprotein [Gammaproteobacteria bacterium]|nr:lipoprotein [Gammaproteobacteria bacterium]